ncbi:hypothetical protein ACFLZL_05610 [Thermodesulfobacteriota bacterium]
MFIFFSDKENEPKEIAPCYAIRHMTSADKSAMQLKADDPVLRASVGVCEIRSPEERRWSQTVTASISTDPVMLGTSQRGYHPFLKGFCKPLFGVNSILAPLGSDIYLRSQ